MHPVRFKLYFNVIYFVWVLFSSSLTAQSLQQTKLTVCRLKYGGGGDWYNDRSIIPNLLNEFSKRAGAQCDPDQAILTPSDPNIFYYPILFITGHGNIVFSDEDIRMLRKHLQNGGFLYVDDDYGLDKAFRREVSRLFPEKELIPVPFSHPIYHCFYSFPRGVPKIHLHDEKPPEGLGIFHEGRLVLFYSYESNISDGWADSDVHHDPPEIREEAFKMGINILYHALNQ